MELRKEGVGVKMDSVLPHLVLVDDDLLSTGIVVYHLKVRGAKKIMNNSINNNNNNNNDNIIV